MSCSLLNHEAYAHSRARHAAFLCRHGATLMSVARDLKAAAAQAGSTDVDELVEIMVGYQAGDPACFDDLYGRLVSPLRGYLISLTRSPDLAADLLQETFLQLHRSRNTYAPPRPVKAWAFGVARNVFLMGRRTRARRKEVPMVEGLEAELAAPSGSARAIDTVLVQSALKHLPRPDREVVLLHHVWGFSFAEVARIVGTTAGAAKVRAHRAMKVLRTVVT